MKKHWKYILAALACAALVVGYLRMGPYGIGRAFSGLGRGPEALYEMQDYVREPDEADFTPGAQWRDTDGELIQAHGGQVQRMPVPVPDGEGGLRECYVWIGENKSNGHFGNCFRVYTSDDLYTWTCRGDVLRSIESREQLEDDPYFAALYAGCTGAELDSKLSN